MRFGMLGLGRMGAHMARRLMRGGHLCVAHDREGAKVAEMVRQGAEGAGSLAELVRKLEPPRVVWMMLPAGDATGGAIRELAELLDADDIAVDGGNSHYKDDVERSKWLGNRGIHFVDCGTSGGIWGETRGYCLMLGGDREAVTYLDPLLRTLAPGRGSIPPTQGRARLNKTAEEGYLYCGGPGAGHFVKMVHNGIEYGLMEAFAEGFDLLNNAHSFGYELPVPDIAELWRRGSVVSAWLLDITAQALAQDPRLASVEGRVADSGEGRWTVEAAVQAGVPCPALTLALYTRFRSRADHTFAEKLLSAMRLGFGGHVEAPQLVAK